MARLTLTLFGSMRVTLDGSPVTTFESDKARALLAYLAIESRQPLSRETLAGLLWPEQPESRARHSLRQALYNLRRALKDQKVQPGVLSSTRDTIQFNRDSDCWLDVEAFDRLVGARTSGEPTSHLLSEAVELYRGSLLEGFSLDDSVPFEEWLLVRREQYRRQVLDALHQLTTAHMERAEYDEALRYAWRLVDADPWREEAQRQVMWLLALTGQRAAALAQFETCRQMLREEFGVEPGAETVALYTIIRDGKIEPAPPARHASPPAFLAPEDKRAEPQPALLVAREAELDALERFLNMAQAGEGRVALVTGGPGSGKTMLIRHFVEQAMARHQELLVTFGNGNAYTGTGDPYHPFIETLKMLSGDVESRWAGGTVSRDHALRVWTALPAAGRALLDEGPDLFGRFVAGDALLERGGAHSDVDASWLGELRAFLQVAKGPSEVEQTQIFEQYARVMRAVAVEHPLLLVLDDLQWLDGGSINLLFHLGRRLAGSRILILGAYRPDDVAIGRDGQRHPLDPVIHEFGRTFGEVQVDLTRVPGQQFVDALLDSEPNRLGANFRRTLLRHTEGQALFTVELLRGLQERGDLQRDASGRWVEGPALDWDSLPARVEAVIAERIGRLPEDCRATVDAASIEGEEFTAEVLAHVLGEDAGEIIRRLSGDLGRRHRLVSAHSIGQTNGRRLSRYRFRHYLFQRYLYTHLDDAERAHLHEATGRAIEDIFGERAGDLAVPLARHFEQAGMIQKAIDYLFEAGNRATRLTANEEAIAHFTRALEHLDELPVRTAGLHQELRLRAALGGALRALRGIRNPEVERLHDHLYRLTQGAGDDPDLFPVIWALTNFYVGAYKHETARGLAERLLHLAHLSGDMAQRARAHATTGTLRYWLGELSPGLAHFDTALACYEPNAVRSLDRRHGAFSYSADLRIVCLGWGANILVQLGYVDRAIKRTYEARAQAAELTHPQTQADVRMWAAWTHWLKGEAAEVRQLMGEYLVLDAAARPPRTDILPRLMLSWALVELGRVDEGLAEWQMCRTEKVDHDRDRTVTGHAFLEAYLHSKAGQPEQGLRLVDRALDWMETTGERDAEPELHRLKGKLLLQAGHDTALAEANFRRAIELARRQQGKSWELRAATSLARLWVGQGKRDGARELLAGVYNWFTEGFDTRDLREARALLDELITI